MTHIIKPTVVDGIEFYVANNGDAGMSLAGLARLCGTDYQVVRNRVKTISTQIEISSKMAETTIYQGSDPDSAYLPYEGERGAKIVSADVCAQVIEHYAFEARNFDNSTALFAYRKFAKMGIQTWIHQVTGYSMAGDTQALLSVMGEVLTELKGLREETKEYKQIQAQVQQHQMIGLSSLLTDLADNEVKALPQSGGDEQGYYTVSEYLATKGVQLDKAHLHRFAGIAASTYRALLQTEPQTVMRESTQGSKTSKVNGYKLEHFAVLQVALTKVISA